MPRASKPTTSPAVPVQEMAAYIAKTSGELALLAGRAKWPLLTYFLNMARVEAEARVALETTKPVRRANARTDAPRARQA